MNICPNCGSTHGHDDECSQYISEFNLAKIKVAIEEQEKEKDRIWDAMSKGKIPYRWQDDPFFL